MKDNNMKWNIVKDYQSSGYSIYKESTVKIEGGGKLTISLTTESSHFKKDTPTKEQMIKACQEMIENLQ